MVIAKGKWNRKRSSQEKWRRLPEEKRIQIMSTVYGESTTYDRVAKDSMQPNNQVAIDHDYYSAHPERASKKMKEVHDAEKDSGYGVGFKGREKETGKDYDKREKYAIGGVAKLRMNYPGA
jgi:hypothetical protein